MDSVFVLGDRAAFLQNVSRSFGCSFICLWSYLPQPYNCLSFLDGVYNEENIKESMASSSSGTTLARRLFDEYRKSVFIVENGRAPGHAFKNSLPYIKFNELELQTLASIETQLQFYQEARIKTAIFMGCKFGEIELGMSTDTQVDLETEIRNWFPEDFSRPAAPREVPQPPAEQNLQSSSSSSYRSLSIDSPEGTPFLYNITSTSYIPTNPLQQAFQYLSQIRNTQFPTIESEDAAMTQAILAVISSSPSPSASSSSSHHQQQQNPSAFKRYMSVLPSTSQITRRVHKQNMLKQSIAFYKSISSISRTQEQIEATSRPTSNQLHHMIAERRRREKLNESFKALRALLPPGTKKDKASVLSSTTEYLNSLKAEVEELTRRNNMLESQLLQQKEVTNQESSVISSSNERLNIQITNIAETTSGARILDLRVTVRGECGMLDFGIRVLEFLKQLRNVSLVSVEADTRMLDSTSVSHFVWRLKIEGGEWDETTFQEAVRRVIGDLAQ